MFAALYAAEGSDAGVLLDVGRAFSPRVQVHLPREVVLDVDGLTRLFGDARSLGAEIRRTAADRSLRVRVALAGSRVTARLLARHRAGLTLAADGDLMDAESNRAAVAEVPLELLADIWTSGVHLDTRLEKHPADAAERARDGQERVRTLRRWGLRTLGELAALPPDDVAARLGPVGAEWWHLARGEDPAPLVPSLPEERFEQALELDWPIEGLEPLSFVLGRLFDPLAAHLERRDRGVAVLHIRLHLVTKTVHEFSLQLPTPMRDARALRTLALLDLESHPPAAAIDRVVVAIDPTPGRVVQFSLLTRPLPSPEQLSTLMARLTALMGEGRCGSPAPVDTWQPGAFAMQPFAPRDAPVSHSHEPRRHGGTEIRTLENLRVSASPRPVEVNGAASSPAVALRRFRNPVPARVHVEDGKPARVTTDRRGLSGGRVAMCAGPWRTSGDWWRVGWDRDEWEVALSDGGTYRVFRERDAAAWFIEGVVD